MKNGVNKEYTHLKSIINYNKPGFYQVVVHNDDFTPREFLVHVLEIFFYMERKIAAQVMMEIKKLGKAACGIYSKDVAETMVERVLSYSKQYEHPLLCSLEVV